MKKKLGPKINSRQKGARGERELANYFSSFGFPARRGQQFSGSKDSPDIVVQGLPISAHFECKLTEKGNLYAWLDQCVADSGDSFPVVCHRRNRRDWVAILPLKDYIELLHRLPVAH